MNKITLQNLRYQIYSHIILNLASFPLINITDEVMIELFNYKEKCKFSWCDFKTWLVYFHSSDCQLHLQKEQLYEINSIDEISLTTKVEKKAENTQNVLSSLFTVLKKK